MRLDDARRLPGGLFHFRAVVLVELDEPLVYVDEPPDGEPAAVGYYQTFGVTAESLARAAALLEAEFAAERQPPGPDGFVRDVELTQVAADEVDPPLSDAALTAPGVHFRSGRVFFGSWDEDEDDEEDDLDDFAGDPDAWKR